MTDPRQPAGEVARILIVDDHPVVREGIAIRIAREPDLVLCGEAATMVEALALVESQQPDLAVIDISLADGDGIDLIQRILARDPRAKMLVWSMYPDAMYAQRALRAGALGYINKQEATGRILEAIRCVLTGRVYLSQAMTEAILHRTVGPAAPVESADPLEALSNRELEVYRLIGRGMTTAEIAASLHLSVHTVETYRQRIKAKLHLHTPAELATAATQWVLENG